MKEKHVAALLALDVLLVGCRSEVLPIPSIGSYAVQQVIELDQLPDMLPPAVAGQADNVVRLTLSVPDTTTAFNAGHAVTVLNATMASGVRVGHSEFVTAGHLLRDKANQPVPGLNGCDRLNVEVATDEPFATLGLVAGSRRDISGASLTQLKANGSFKSEPGVISDVPDIGLVQTQWDVTGAPPLARVAAERPEPNDVVYMQNYQPDSSGGIRTPYELRLNQESVARGDNQPAAYGGVVLGYTADGRILVAEGLKSYGQSFEDRTHGGASGGPVYNQQGELVGMASAIAEDTEHAQAVGRYLDLPQAITEQLEAVVYVQQLTPELLSQAEMATQSAPACRC